MATSLEKGSRQGERGTRAHWQHEPVNRPIAQASDNDAAQTAAIAKQKAAGRVDPQRYAALPAAPTSANEALATMHSLRQGRLCNGIEPHLHRKTQRW